MARVLVVDDEPDVRELFNITLKMAGHVTDTAQDGLEAVDKLAGEMPDLILLDLMMPHMDGFGFLSHVRDKLDSKPVRVLVATAKVLEESDHEKLRDWPVVGVLNKGELDIGQMVIVVRSALSKDALRPDGKDKAQEDKEVSAALGIPAQATPASQPVVSNAPPQGTPPATPEAKTSADEHSTPGKAASGPPKSG